MAGVINYLTGKGAHWFDDSPWGTGMYSGYAGYGGYGGHSRMSNYGFINPSRPREPHDRLLDQAMYAWWCKEDKEGYQYLADAYNEHVRKPDEPVLLPPPSYL